MTEPCSKADVIQYIRDDQKTMLGKIDKIDTKFHEIDEKVDKVVQFNSRLLGVWIGVSGSVTVIMYIIINIVLRIVKII